MKPETIHAAVPYLYEVVKTIPREKARSSYAMKHDVEHLFNEYCSNDELKDALRDRIGFNAGRLDRWNQSDYYFYVKPKFELFWLRTKPTERPKGGRKTQWEAYQQALAWATQHQASQTAPAPASGSLGTPQSSPAHSSRVDG